MSTHEEIASLKASARAPTYEAPATELWLPRSARLCYELFCDVERMPEWFPVVQAVSVQSTNRNGRPRRVAVRAALRRATVGYTLVYTYRERDHRVAWCPRVDSGMMVGGWAQFHPVGLDSCILVCDLWLDPGAVMAGWDDPFLDARPAAAVTARFRDFVLRSTRALSQEITQPRAF